MFQPGSNQRDYTLCSQYDRALDLPEVPEVADLAPDADEAAQAARAAAIAAAEAAQAERDQKLKVARDRSEWATLIKPGGKPTVFTFRQIPRRSMNWLLAERERRNLSHVETIELMFRLAIAGVDNFGTFKAEINEDTGHRLLTLDSFDKLYEGLGPQLAARVVLELGSIVMAKTMRGVGPL